MQRQAITTEAEARAELTSDRSKPEWREQRHFLPFHELSDDEFEVFCFLLLKAEHPNDDIRYYGKTGDGGRDVMHRRMTDSGPIVRLVQCKRYESNVPIGVVRKDMAKVFVNVLNGTIPERPQEVVFYAAPDLTNPAKSLIESQDNWREEALDAIKEHLGSEVTPSQELIRHAREWWPTPTSEGALSLTQRSKRFPHLLDEFFATKKVIEGTVADVSNAVCDRVLPPIVDLRERVARLEAELPPPRPEPASPQDVKAAFASSSSGLLHWPTTVSAARWLDRPELKRLVGQVAAERSSVTLVLGPPGSGKSALLARFGQQMVGNGIVVLAIKADQMRSFVDSEAKLAERLNLTLLVHQAVSLVGQLEPVVVLLDQLDALADLADLRSERLQVLLDLVAKSAGRPNVHLVCSCREFEYQHDGRLGRLDAQVIRLQLPTWGQVSSVLAAHDVAAEGWPDDAKELLRTPHHLDLFLKSLRGSSEHTVFTSYQQLVNQLWQDRVVKPAGGRFQLLHDLATWMADEEELWIDRGRLEERWPTAEELIADDFLSLSEDGFRVGFRHQSLYEFTRAKTFAKEGVSLAEYVLDRQDALFVRPTLWMTLNHLRRAAPKIYAREFNLLWSNPKLRRHVKHLLIDFLGQVEEPQPFEWEIGRLVETLGDVTWRRKALIALTGKPTWFRLLAGTHLAAIMRQAPEIAWDAVWVIDAAFRTDRDECLKLLESHWLPDDSKLPLIWQVLSRLDAWCNRAVRLALEVVRRTNVDHGGMWFLAQNIAKGEPVFAVELVAEWLDSARQRLGAAGDADRESFGNLLGFRIQWHDLETISARIPAEFVRLLWPVTCAILLELPPHPSAYVIRYSDGRIWNTRLDREEYVPFDRPDCFFLALDSAVRAFAASHPVEFTELVRSTGNPDQIVLHRLMCRGLREIASAFPTTAANYLLADTRRLWLGGSHDNLSDSIALIRDVGPHLGQHQFDQLVEAIRNWEPYRLREGEPDENRTCEYARGHRYRLLDSLPESRLSDEVRGELNAERAALREQVRVARSNRRTGPRAIVSPLSHQEMSCRPDEDILALFEELPDSTGDHHPNDWMTGGSVQLSFEFQKVAKAEPARALEVISRFRPGAQERPAAHGVRGLVEAGYLRSAILSAVHDLDARGFAGSEFRETVASALRELARDGGLPDATCDLLENWRQAEWPSSCQDGTRNEPDSCSGQSILWAHGATLDIPGGRFPVLEALTLGYLCRTPCAADRWLAMLNEHLERDEDLITWQTLCLHLGDLWCCADRDGARSFAESLLIRFPRVTSCSVGVHFLARIAQLLSTEARQAAYGYLLGNGTEWGRQAFGELVCLRHMLHPEEVWPSEQLEAAFLEADRPESEVVLLGVSFAAVNLWEEPRCREAATGLLLRLLALPSERIGAAAMSVFSTHDELPHDDATRRLLRQIDAHPHLVTRKGVDEAFFDHLLDAFAWDAELVCRISEEAVRLRGSELQSMQHGFFLASSPLIDISFRLQRSGASLRARGMQLFESLLDLGVSEAVNVARSNDLRLTSGGGRIHRHKRQR